MSHKEDYTCHVMTCKEQQVQSFVAPYRSRAEDVGKGDGVWRNERARAKRGREQES
jgi:hypothetical protein